MWQKKIQLPDMRGKEILHNDKEKLWVNVAIETITVIIIVIGWFRADFLMWLAHRTAQLHYPISHLSDVSFTG